MKKGVYITYNSSASTAGVDRKIDGQILAMREAGIRVRKICMGVRKIPGWKFWYRIPFTNVNPYWKWHKEFEVCDFIYLRYPSYLNMALLRLLRKIRKKNPDVKIIMELHSGIAWEYMIKVPKMIPLLLKELVCMPFLKKYVDVMAAIGDLERVYCAYGIKIIEIKNGLDFSTMRVRKVLKQDDSIHLAIVSMMCAAHGYERLLEGLYNYYNGGGCRKIMLHFIGEGAELSKYKNLVRKYRLADSVIFYGIKNLEQMQKIYDNCDIGVSALGLYKLKINVSTVLKLKEYIAAGLPVIGAGKMDIADIPEIREYVLRIPNKDEPVEMNRIIKFYDRIYDGKTKKDIEKTAELIRTAGECRLDYKSAFENVVKYILN